MRAVVAIGVLLVSLASAAGLSLGCGRKMTPKERAQ
jgi:hypothetical protein